MTLSSKLCISLVALALTTGGAFAATTVSGTRSNSDGKTAMPGTPTPDAGKVGGLKRMTEGVSTDNSNGCTNGDGSANARSSGGSNGFSRGNGSGSTAQGSTTGGDGRSEVKDSHDRYNRDSSASASQTSAKACDNAKGHSVLMQQGRAQ